MKNLIPKPEAIAREVILFIITGIVATIIVNQVPALKKWFTGPRQI